MKKINGLTLIETLAYLSIFSGAFAGVYKIKQDYNKTIEKETFTNNVEDLMFGIDQRISIDGFEATLWNEQNWTDREEISELLVNKQLRPSSNYSKFSTIMKKNGCEGEWEPQNDLNEKSNLVQCNMWKNKIPLDLEAKGELKKDVNGFIKSVEFTFNFKDDMDFEENIISLRRSYSKLKEKEDKGISGKFHYNFIDQSNNDISIGKCIELKSDCHFKAVFDREGGNEELRTDGGNSMINSSVNFISSKNNSPFKCIRWTKSNSGLWDKVVDEDNCGIGIYSDESLPVIAEVIAKNGTFENVLLDKECNLFNWDNFNNKLQIDTLKTTACGMTKDSNEIFQVIQNIKAKNGYTENFYFKDLQMDIFNVDSIIAEDVNVDFVNVSNNLTVDNEATFNELDVSNYSKLEGQTNAYNKLNAYGDAIVYSDTSTNQKIETKDLKVLGDTNAYSLNAENVTTDIAYAHEELSTNLIKFGTNYNSGDSCLQEGLVAKKSSGATLVCKKNKWASAISGVPIGTINAWTSYSIPAGWLKCNGSSIPSKHSELRNLVGGYTPDLRGRFVRGYGGLSGGLGSVQGEEIKSHRHTEKRFNGRDDAGGGRDKGANDAIHTTSTGWSGIESRPKNYSVIYIIKAE